METRCASVPALILTPTFDAVTTGLKVNGNLHAPFLCVSDVFKVASGDLKVEIPGADRRDEIGALAGALERRLPARWVLRTGPVVQAALALVIVNALSFAPYAAAASVFAAVMIFTHTFAFGTLARLDPSGRALAATPAMLMAGAALGPILGGTLVQWQGYPALGWAAAAVG